MKKYSENFNTIFKFFYLVVRKDIISFCGTKIEVEYDKNGYSAKECFRRYEDGQYSKEPIIKTRHPLILKNILIGKKGWGLWLKEWTKGIKEGVFTKKEILSLFEEKNIIIPESLLKDFLYNCY